MKSVKLKYIGEKHDQRIEKEAYRLESGKRWKVKVTEVMTLHAFYTHFNIFVVM